MAKTFKNLPRPGDPKAAKPTSERDFFDLSDEHEPVEKPADKPERASNIGNTSNTRNTSNTPTVTIEAAGLEPGPASPAAPADGVRQTFVVSRGHLEQLRDYVHARRTQGEYTYSQKQALQEALDLLFAGAAPAPPRPAQARAQEQQRRQRIQQGRRPEVGNS
ncbi:hypothetical protein ACFQT0_26405 [Hymenobacter humi]|uniref:DUF3408 domain-containing protein n=1 Tax=Hymenobacter humi TaxID=1411620 RepID=A0ABW2UAU8_9BACT